MKKILITAFAILSLYAKAQTVAPDFTINDCSGTNHDLYTELDAGKVVVIVFVMPCASCIGPALSAFNEVQNYAVSNPGRVVMYISDDLGTTSCATLTSWINTNGMTGTPGFSNTALKEADYGPGGMPKIVVIAGTNHDVIFTENGGLNVTNFNNAINQGLVAGINVISTADFKMNLFPCPVAKEKTTITYALPDASDVTFEIYNAIGSMVKTINIGKQAAGKHESVLEIDTLANGVYFIRLNSGGVSQVLRFTVSHL